MGVLATGVAIGIQGDRAAVRIHLTHVALLFALQKPLFTALCGWLFLDDHLGAAEWTGGGLIIAGVVVAARERTWTILCAATVPGAVHGLKAARTSSSGDLSSASNAPMRKTRSR